MIFIFLGVADGVSVNRRITTLLAPDNKLVYKVTNLFTEENRQ